MSPETNTEACNRLWDELVRREGSPAGAVAVLLAYAVSTQPALAGCADLAAPAHAAA